MAACLSADCWWLNTDSDWLIAEYADGWLAAKIQSKYHKNARLAYWRHKSVVFGIFKLNMTNFGNNNLETPDDRLRDPRDPRIFDHFQNKLWNCRKTKEKLKNSQGTRQSKNSKFSSENFATKIVFNLTLFWLQRRCHQRRSMFFLKIQAWITSEKPF